MEGGGTPDEVRAFHDYLKDVQALAGRLVALMVLHHENTAGRISGAWTGRPDLLVHVTAQGHGKTRVHWQKAKWTSPLHGTTNHLHWTDGEGFELAPEEAPRPERAWDDIADLRARPRRHQPGGRSAKPSRARTATWQRRRDAMLEDGLLINAGRRKRLQALAPRRPGPPTARPEHRAEDRTTAAFPHALSGVEGDESGVRRCGSSRTAPHARPLASTPDHEGTGPHDGPHDEPADDVDEERDP